MVPVHLYFSLSSLTAAAYGQKYIVSLLLQIAHYCQCPPTSRNTQVFKSDSEEICFQEEIFWRERGNFWNVNFWFFWRKFWGNFLRKIVGNIPWILEILGRYLSKFRKIKNISPIMNSSLKMSQLWNNRKGMLAVLKHNI